MKRNLIALLICTLACNHEQTGDVNSDAQLILKDTFKLESKPVRNSSLNVLHTSMNDDAIVLGDSVTGQIHYLALKFEPHIRFTDFPAGPVYTGSASKINFTSHPIAKTFRTRIMETVQAQGVNFAGHYCLVTWGCGSPCQMSVVVDLRSGNVYDGKTASLGYEFQATSRMLIVNPVGNEVDTFHPGRGYYLDCPYCKPEICVWNEVEKQFESR